MKFGGTSVGDAESIARVVNILAQYHAEGHELAVVVSAMSGVTDRLHAIAAEAESSVDDPQIATFVQALRTKHMKALRAVAPSRVDEVGAVIDERLWKLDHILTAVHSLHELTQRSRDYIVSYGERLSSLIVSAALNEAGVSSVALDGCEAGVLTTDRHGDALVLPSSDATINSRVLPLLMDTVPVITGYMGCTPEGIVTTLGRSGSDYSAAVIGRGIEADEVWIWTDVDGVLTSDPRVVQHVRVLPYVSYREAMELSYFGAKVLHPKSIEPAMEKNIVVRVKNTFNPDHPGTVVRRQENREKRVVKAVSHIDQVALLNVNGVQMIGRPGTAKEIFSLLGDAGVNVMMISQASSQANISMVIEEADLAVAKDVLSGPVKAGLVREVTADRNVVAVAVVGAGMAGTPGISGRIFTALGDAGINVMMISQGSSEVNVSFVVKQEEHHRALQVLHDEFRLSEECDDE
ncbi:aspartate kinase [Methanofollis sp. W23]|uniref:aspartate kinase n=1 Tax=Methanofollis sp. W23 TaxID=2817849 RepID=UPI001AE3BA9B|nr:aspartate kinase [Methanofollis sp. W23]MBP2147039.1 aspartate kinase [Methanofollis sp. W23]